MPFAIFPTKFPQEFEIPLIFMLHQRISQQLLGSLGRLGYLQKAGTQHSLNLKVLIKGLSPVNWFSSITVPIWILGLIKN
jgi:hypothetical protein